MADWRALLAAELSFFGLSLSSLSTLKRRLELRLRAGLFEPAIYKNQTVRKKKEIADKEKARWGCKFTFGEESERGVGWKSKGFVCEGSSRFNVVVEW